jgi:hypothetical protein
MTLQPEYGRPETAFCGTFWPAVADHGLIHGAAPRSSSATIRPDTSEYRSRFITWPHCLRGLCLRRAAYYRGVAPAVSGPTPHHGQATPSRANRGTRAEKCRPKKSLLTSIYEWPNVMPSRRAPAHSEVRFCRISEMGEAGAVRTRSRLSRSGKSERHNIDHFSLFPEFSFLNRSTVSAMASSGDFVIIMFTGITTSQSIGSISSHVSSAMPLPNTL